ncbi:oxidoreductase [Lophiotrema nucula]|uniref:Oxidoreductase n=1 Tax=Lophiotrema nucula TaxID=690887 RepID=A0A6A5YVP4_9PLEO|nr:oxidoreductase [Lophiotrema nucula]
MNNNPSTQRLAGKIAIITGGGGGLGKGTAQKFVDEGAKVIIAEFKEDLGKVTAKELGCDFQKCDVSKKSDWEALLQYVDKTYGRLDCVVNNAGTSYRNKATVEVNDDEFDQVFSVNVKAIYNSYNVLVPYIQKKGNGGSFVTIGSVAAVRPTLGLTWYNASKAAVMLASKSLALEYAADQIRFNNVLPTFAPGTGLQNRFLGLPDDQKEFESNLPQPMGRGCTPRDIANACCYLCSDEANFITGIDLPVDGGRLI